MKIAVVGAGHIGGNLAARWAQAGHEVMISFTRSPEKLAAQAADIGATSGEVPEAAAFGDVVLISVHWNLMDDVLGQVGPLAGKVVVDTTNQYGAKGLTTSAAEYIAGRVPDAHYAKSFNTLTSKVQRSADAADPDAMFYTAEDDTAASTVDRLVADCGFAPTRLPWAQAAMLEAGGPLYNVVYRPEAAAKIVEAAATDPATAAELAKTLRHG